MNKDGAAPSFASHRDETAVRFNQTIEIMRLRHGQKRAIEPITPRMIRADEAHRLTLRLIQNGRRAMATNIMKRPNDVVPAATDDDGNTTRSEEHTSELQSLMRISYAVFCLKKKNKQNQTSKER